MAVTAQKTRMAMPMLWLNPRAYRYKGTVRRPADAARRGSLGWDDGGVSFEAAIRG
jgi:hypothetical protein